MSDINSSHMGVDEFVEFYNSYHKFIIGIDEPNHLNGCTSSKRKVQLSTVMYGEHIPVLNTDTHRVHIVKVHKNKCIDCGHTRIRTSNIHDNHWGIVDKKAFEKIYFLDGEYLYSAEGNIHTYDAPAYADYPLNPKSGYLIFNKPYSTLVVADKISRVDVTNHTSPYLCGDCMKKYINSIIDGRKPDKIFRSLMLFKITEDQYKHLYSFIYHSGRSLNDIDFSGFHKIRYWRDQAIILIDCDRPASMEEEKITYELSFPSESITLPPDGSRWIGIVEYE